jgi:penicillin-binding protein 2
MLAGFEGAVQSQGGTASGTFAGFPFSQLPLAGKTGTAQVNGKSDTSVFVGWGPATNPQFLVTAFLEEAGFGASGAAPVARHIFEGLAGLTPGPVTYQGVSGGGTL